MSCDNRTKINKLFSIWPRGTVVVLKWLKKKGYSQQLINKYMKSSWLKNIGHGAYIRLNDQIELTGGLYALQKQLNFPVYIGAKSSLQIQGYSHFLPQNSSHTIYLFSKPIIKLPIWFIEYKWNYDVKFFSTNLFKSINDKDITAIKINEYKIYISSRERAILEVLYMLPNHQSFEEALQLMEGLTTLRPELLQSLLERCQSFKVKRLFMIFAELLNHQWLQEINTANINFGNGKRMLVKGGKYNAKYKITLPENIVNRDKFE